MLDLQDPLALRDLLDYLAALVLLDRLCTLKELKRHRSQGHRGLQEPLVYLGSRELWEPEGKEVHRALKVKLETQERTGRRANLGRRWMYRGLWPALASR